MSESTRTEASEASRDERALAFWKQHLAGAPTALELPTDRPRPAIQSSSNNAPSTRAAVPFVIPAQVAAGLRALSAKHDATLFMTMLGAFAVLLARHANQRDIVIGSPIAGRTTLPHRVRINDEDSFDSLLASIRASTFDAFQHQDVRFERIVEAINPPPDTSRSPLFQALFLFHNSSDATPSRPSIADLSLAVQDGPDALNASFELNTELFDRATIEALRDRFLTLLTKAVARPSQRIDYIDILPEGERRRLVLDWNRTEHAVEPRDVLDAFRAAVENHPERTAVAFESSSISYAQLESAALDLASQLAHAGVGPESLVGIFSERSIDLLVAIFAILIAGGAYVPLDPEHPDDRLAWVTEDANLKLILAAPPFVERARALGAPVMTLERASRRTGFVPPKVNPAQSAYVIFTSGSTGRPKGVINTREGLANRLAWMQAQYRLSPSDVVIQKTPFTFDVSVWELVWPFLHGATLFVARPGGHRAPAYLLDEMQRRGVTVAHFVPSMLRAFLETASASQQRPAALRLTVCSGEALAEDLVAQHAALIPGQLANLYGPTEAAIDVTFWDRPDDYRGEVVPIGRPVWNTQLYVVDRAMNLVPTGALGELLLGGVQLARGYSSRSALTAERFIPDPFGASGRLYRTGDLVRQRADGSVEYRGRIDHQVKIRGLRIELGEIEIALANCSGVDAAVVIARDLANGDKQLVGYVLATDGAALDLEGVKRELAKSLPVYMVPSVLVVLPAFPLTSSGKIDRKALPAPVAAASEGAMPADALERVVAEVLAEVLKVPSVGADDSFMALGGSSLSALRVLAGVETSLGVALPFDAVFKFPTARQLSAELARRGARPPEPGRANVDPSRIPRLRTRDGSLPIGIDQFPYWFTEQMMPGINISALRMTLQRGRRLNLRALQRAFDAVIFRNENLRTTYSLQKGKPVMRIEPAGRSQPVGFTDLRGLDPSEQTKEVARIEHAVKNDKFDLKKGPVLRAHAISLHDDHHIVIACGHHTAWDAHSSVKLGHEFSVFYDTFDRGEPITLPPLRVQYADYSAWQRARLETGEGARAIDYWEGRLRGIVPLALPTDRPRHAKTSSAAKRVAWTVDPAVCTRLRELAVKESTTIFTVVAAATALAVGRCSGATDVVLGTPVSTRDRPELDDLLGCFVNSLPLRIDIGTNDLGELLRRTQVATNEAVSHNVPFDRISERMGRQREPGRQPLYDVTLAPQSDASQPASDAFQVYRFEAESTSIDRDLQFQIEQLGDPIHGWTQYRVELYDEKTVQRIVDDLLAIFSAMAEHRLPS